MGALVWGRATRGGALFSVLSDSGKALRKFCDLTKVLNLGSFWKFCLYVLRFPFVCKLECQKQNSQASVILGKYISKFSRYTVYCALHPVSEATMKHCSGDGARLRYRLKVFG